uniref:ThiS n=2 Tax=Alaria TaxID=2888 RepID=A0A8E8PDZ4_9PHAE|nr:thiS [Alaria crispa]YP_010206855.1 thiS [Alaria esculenta]QWE51188.1 thiS [Alaria crispa]QWE51368.1 thiS [Alaria esculenta]UAX20465.1 thiS [Alaria crispa]UAX20606.1 thiS [Alaria crispa]UAX20747.1 thiS [Alaria crispa]
MKINFFLLLVSLNGCEYKVYMTQPSQVFDLLEFFNHQKELVIIQHNGKIHNDLNKTQKYVKQKDKIEVITIVGGG